MKRLKVILYNSDSLPLLKTKIFPIFPKGIAGKNESRLPEGMDWQQIPKFVKVNGWEKNSPTLK